MAFDEVLADRARGVLAGHPGFGEKRMFGGVAFFVGDHLCCGVYESGLLVRLGPDRAAEALDQDHVGPMEMGDRRMRGFVVVGPEGLEGDRLRRWVERGVELAEGLPPKSRR